MNTPHRSSLLPITISVLTAGIFIIDAFTPLDIAIAVLYVIVVLLSAEIWQRRGVLLMTSLCLILTTIGYIFSHGLNFYENSFARGLVSLIAITVTAFLALKNQEATLRLLQREEALHHSQAQLAHVTRITMLGELTASIAHEVNQPLAAITTNGAATLRWLDRPVPDLEEARAALGNIIGDTRRASEVIKRIRALARKGNPQYSGLDLNDVIGESVTLVQREMNRNDVNLRFALASRLPAVQADRVQLQQVVINLLVNGMQAMVENEVSQRYLSLRTWTKNDEVILEIADTGPGIPSGMTNQLFEAFFTTKKEGMGMGLSICRSIIESHGGRIWAQENCPTGAAFRFSLPIMSDQVVQ